MPEILIISNEQCIVDIVGQLRTRLDAGVDIVNDFSQGLKEIFFRQPAVVFVQNEIEGITGEKVASQVRALLEGEPIRLVLLRKEGDPPQTADSKFDGSVDMSLPAEELVRQIRQQVYDALNAVTVKPETAGESLQSETGTVELTMESPEAGDEFKIESLADVFPASFPDDWNTTLPNGADSQSAMDPALLDPTAITPEGEFRFDDEPGHGMPSADTADSLDPLILKGAELFNDVAPEPSLSAPESQGADGNSRNDRQEVLQQPTAVAKHEGTTEFPRVSDSVSQARVMESERSGETLLAKAIAREKSKENLPPPAATVSGNGQVSSPAAGKTPLRRSGELKAPASWDGEISAGAKDDDDYIFREEFRGKTSFIFKIFIGTVIFAIFVAVFFLTRQWLEQGEQEAVTTTSPAPPATMHGDLPSFIPRLAPDSAYSAAHPGWERREADGIEYLVFRENGRIKAIQIVAGAQGVITASLLKTCIRETAGQEGPDKWVREKRDDFLVEKGTLPNRGELAVYRKMPEGEIRGIVIAYD